MTTLEPFQTIAHFNYYVPKVLHVLQNQWNRSRWAGIC